MKITPEYLNGDNKQQPSPGVLKSGCLKQIKCDNNKLFGIRVLSQITDEAYLDEEAAYVKIKKIYCQQQIMEQTLYPHSKKEIFMAPSFILRRAIGME